MKVILSQDVRALGKKGQVVNVSDGYARNFILPRKLGIEANSRNLNDLKLKREQEERTAEKNLERAKALAEKLSRGKVALSIKVGEGGKAFGSVSAKEIASAVKEQLGIEIDRKKIKLSEPIKVLGVQEVAVKLHPLVSAAVKVEVRQEV